MDRQPRFPWLLVSSLVIVSLFRIESAHAQGRPGTAPQNKLDEIVERLARIEAKLDAPSASTTFCISQGRGLDLTGKVGIETAAEIEVGAGWPNVLLANAKGKVNFPVLAPVPPFLLPSEVAVELGGGHGRNFDICVDLPLTLSAGDQAQLTAIWTAMNDPANLGDSFSTKGKFQRRAARVINYACRRVRGVLQCPLLPNVALTAASQSNSEHDAEAQEFDRADSAAENLLEQGLGPLEEGVQAFRQANIVELLASLELPADVRTIIEEPEKIFEGVTDLAGGVPNCDSLQITAAMRSRHPLLNSLCSELSSLPAVDVVKGAFNKIDQLSDEVLDAIAEIVGPLLTNVGEAPQTTRNRFCSSSIGQRPVFNRYCGR